MDEQRLWAPWRMNYIAGDKSAEATGQEPIAWLPGADTACFICKATAAYSDEAAARTHFGRLSASGYLLAGPRSILPDDPDRWSHGRSSASPPT